MPLLAIPSLARTANVEHRWRKAATAMHSPRVGQTIRVKTEVLPFVLIDGGTGGEGGIIPMPFLPLLAAVPVMPATYAAPAAQIFPCVNEDEAVLPLCGTCQQWRATQPPIQAAR